MALTEAMNIYHNELMMKENFSFMENYLEEEIGIQYAEKSFKELAIENKLGMKSKDRNIDFLFQKLKKDHGILELTMDGLIKTKNEEEVVDVFFNTHFIIPTLNGDNCLGLYGKRMQNNNHFFEHLRTSKKFVYPEFRGKVIFTEGELQAFVLKALGFKAHVLPLHKGIDDYSDDFEPYIFFDQDRYGINKQDEFAKNLRKRGINAKIIKADTDVKKILLTYKENAKDFVEDRITKSYYSLRTIF